jgi:RNA polymerase sigma factor (sigma-70 family)
MSPSVSVRLLLTQSDARLVELARAGHERAFEALVQRYRRPLLGYCRRLLLPHERAEDALQQGLLQAWLSLRNGTQVRDVKPWLYRIVHNTALNMLRSSGYDYATLNEALSGAGAPSEDLDRRIAVREALAGLAALPDKQREALLRTAVDGSSYQQAAATMGLSESALRGLVHRARATLRTAATALTPSPLLSWALSVGGSDASLSARLVEAGASGGSIGLGGLLVKASATVVTAGVLVGGIPTLHHPQRRREARQHQRSVPTGADARGSDREGATGELASGQGHLGGSTASNLLPAARPAPHRLAAYVVPRAGTHLRRHAGDRRPLRRISTITPSQTVVPARHPTGAPAPAARPTASATHTFRHDGGGDRSGAGSSDPQGGSSGDGGASHDGSSRDGGGHGGASGGDASGPTQGSGSASPDGHSQEPSGGWDGSGETHRDGSGPSGGGSGDSGVTGEAGSGAGGSGAGGSGAGGSD